MKARQYPMKKAWNPHYSTVEALVCLFCETGNSTPYLRIAWTLHLSPRKIWKLPVFYDETFSERYVYNKRKFIPL